ncbi:MAG: hypothetical protein K0U74_17065 [Alphaproteobacteria bacterium]|nr:hypothetical protein [Alphaproteobacteria bacterium]
MRSGLYTALFLSSAILASGGASAADLGGDCCADLEERVAELEATTARKGNRKVSLTVYGQVNQAVMFWDDSTENNIYVVNNKASTSHFGFEGSAAINSEWSAGFRLEIETASANSDFVDQGFVPAAPGGLLRNQIGVGDEGRTGLFLRHAQWYLSSKRLGRLTVGQQSNATDNIAEMDLSRTSVVSLSSVETANEGFFLRDKDTGLLVQFPGIFAAAGANTSLMGDLFRGNLDGGRGNLVRYDTPVIAGFILSTAWGEDDDWDIGLRYGGDIGDISIRAGIGYHTGKILDTDNVTSVVGANSIPDHEEVVGSISALHKPTGLFVTVAGGGRNWIDSPVSGLELLGEKYFYVKSGLLRRWFTLGDTAIYGEYYKIWDVGLEFAGPASVFNERFDEEAYAFGFGVVQHVDAAAMELYLAYKHYGANDITDFSSLGGGALTDHDIQMDIVMGGARIKF